MLTTLGATLFGGLGAGGVPAACVFLVIGWVDTPRYLALVSGSLAAYAFALWLAEHAARVAAKRTYGSRDDGGPPVQGRPQARVNWPDDWLRS